MDLVEEFEKLIESDRELSRVWYDILSLANDNGFEIIVKKK